jgi:hypothetical protein
MLPMTLSDVTPEVVTGFLQCRFPGTVVTSLTVGRVISGTCTKVRLLLEYNDDGHRHGLPPTMCMKAGFEDHGLAGQVFPREVWFYERLASQIGGSLPTCYFAGRNERQAIILMEDLLARNARFARASDAATVEQVRSLLEILAAVHGRYWGNGDLYGLVNEPDRKSGCAVLDFSDQALYQPDNFARMANLPRTAVVPAELRDLGNARRYLQLLIRWFDAGPRCLIHGDAHLGNTFHSLRGGDAGYIDWQTYTGGHWAQDVSHLLCTALTVEDRRRHERPLVAHYLGELARHGTPAPNFDEAWLSYRRMAFYAFAWAICPPELQPEDICMMCADRAVSAIADLETLAALGS